MLRQRQRAKQGSRVPPPPTGHEIRRDIRDVIPVYRKGIGRQVAAWPIPECRASEILDSSEGLDN